MEIQENKPESQPQEALAAASASKRGRWWVAGIVFAVLAIAGGATWFFIDKSNAEAAEEEAYEILENNYNAADYEAFLADFPNSVHTRSVRERLAKLQAMETAWKAIALSGNAGDFVRFKSMYPSPYYDKLCDIKIDSLDWLLAQQMGTPEAYARYMELHPEGRYASEAAITESTVKSLTVTPEEHESISELLASFFSAFGENDEVTLCGLITPVMDNFLNKREATKADVVESVKRMFNEHILKCTFVLTGDLNVTKVPGENGTKDFRVTFDVDQHIDRDNEGKTFGSYKATAEVTGQFMLKALTMQEISKR